MAQSTAAAEVIVRPLRLLARIERTGVHAPLVFVVIGFVTVLRCGSAFILPVRRTREQMLVQERIEYVRLTN